MRDSNVERNPPERPHNGDDVKATPKITPNTLFYIQCSQNYLLSTVSKTSKTSNSLGYRNSDRDSHRGSNNRGSNNRGSNTRANNRSSDNRDGNRAAAGTGPGAGGKTTWWDAMLVVGWRKWRPKIKRKERSRSEKRRRSVLVSSQSPDFIPRSRKALPQRSTDLSMPVFWN